MHKYQGSLDGLCGPHAVVNAFHLLGCDDEVLEDIFKVVCQSPVRSRWPDLLWEGTGLGALQRMTRSVMKLPCIDTSDLKVVCPFLNNNYVNTKNYWEHFCGFTDNERFKCGILGIHSPSEHWIVFKREGRLIEFYDSSPKRPRVRKRIRSIDAAGRRRKPANWLVEPRKTILFQSRS